MNTLIIFIWIIITFLVGSLAGILGKKYGPEYPIAIVAALVVMANIFANKIIILGPFTVPAGIIVFSMTFFITDILSEKFSKKHAQKAVWAGFISSILLIISILIIINLDSAPFAKDTAIAFQNLLSLTPRITIAGLIAYIISQHHDVFMFHKLKKLTKGKHLWFRNNTSTILSQLIDSTIFITIAFYGIYPILPLILGQFIIKIIIALIDTPFLYLTISFMDKIKR